MFATTVFVASEMTLTVFDPIPAEFATNGPANGISILPPARVEVGTPVPVRSRGARGDGSDTATAAANMPITISPTPTNASTRLTAIAPQPRIEKEREVPKGPSIHKVILPSSHEYSRVNAGLSIPCGFRLVTKGGALLPGLSTRK